MHCLRRPAARAIVSSASALSKSHTIPSISPFLCKPKAQIYPPVSRYFSKSVVKSTAQDDAVKGETQQPAPTSTDSEEQSSISSAVSSASAAASTVAHEATEAVNSSIDASRESIVAAARAAANAIPGQETLAFDDNAQQRDERSAFRNSLTPTNSIYVGNLLFEVTEQDLKDFYSPLGTVLDVKIARDFRQLSKGFAYITFETVQEATAAIKSTNDEIFAGRKLVVNYMAHRVGTPRKRMSGTPTKTLFIGNLAYEMTDSDLNKLFRQIRNVIDVRVAIDRRTGQPRGFAHADFVDVASAEEALGQLDNREFYGRFLRVDFAREPTARPASNVDANPRFGGMNESSGGHASF